jgi:hypothetical protein
MQQQRVGVAMEAPWPDARPPRWRTAWCCRPLSLGRDGHQTCHSNLTAKFWRSRTPNLARVSER